MLADHHRRGLGEILIVSDRLKLVTHIARLAGVIKVVLGVVRHHLLGLAELALLVQFAEFVDARAQRFIDIRRRIGTLLGDIFCAQSAAVAMTRKEIRSIFTLL